MTPERLEKPEYLELLKRSGVSLFVIDEAHCVSQWGHDFRPAYLGLGNAIRALGRPRVLALTATAPPAVAADICQQLGLRNPAGDQHRDREARARPGGVPDRQRSDQAGAARAIC